MNKLVTTTFVLLLPVAAWAQPAGGTVEQLLP